MNTLVQTKPRPDESVLSTLNRDGSRRWIRPRLSPGSFLTARRAVGWLLIAIFTLIPYLTLNDRPLVLLDLPARRFTLFGHTFLPTDTLLLALLIVGVFLTIFFLTAIFGRVWCGWACPQTVYMEFLFRPLERLFDGAPGRVNTGGFRGSGPARLLKYVCYLLAAAFLAHTFLAYFVGVEQLRYWILGSPLDHPVGFLVVAAVTALMLFDFGFFREQVCLLACPYGRLQSALLDRRSLIISYDRKRGEPRGKSRRKPVSATPVDLTIGATDPEPLGDCIDCQMCVTTCPTGIDIRNGLQMECIGCAQCIDACDAIMTKISRPRGLIRYTSQAALEGSPSRIVRPRVVIYSTILALVTALFLLVLSASSGLDISVLRGLGQPYSTTADGRIRNPVRIRLTNRGDGPASVSLTVLSPEGCELVIDEAIAPIEPGAEKMIVASLVAPKSAFSSGRAAAVVQVSSGNDSPRDARFIMTGPRR
jgi:cytochrome c oxidase accessory protein FixG